ncbi:hypothetical protein BC833DRAFT_411353 [Globomyces pollinis-pini]|nr:hypothetical protein BC833DRAFT_411353 [Globomyces pollinis-pini]
MDPFSTPVASPYSSLENQHYAKLWKIADPESKGVLGPQQAVLFLTKSLLEQATLSQIWKLSDSDSKGYLNQQDFFKALKLVSIAQAEKPLSTPLSTTTLLPTFKGILDSSAPTQPMQFQNTGVTQPMQFQNTGESTLSRATTSIRPVQKLDAGSFTVTAEERTRFTSFFEASNPIDGFLSGDVVKGIFMKSQLPNETLFGNWLTKREKESFLLINLSMEWPY